MDLNNFCIILEVLLQPNMPIVCYHQLHTYLNDKFSKHLELHYQYCMMHVSKSYIWSLFSNCKSIVLHLFLSIFKQYLYDYHRKDLI
jgi:hypothetical protein